MLLATIALLPPALGRMRVLNAVGPQAFFGVTVLFIAAVVAYDYWTRRRVHAVSLGGGLFLALSFPGRIALGHTDARLSRVKRRIERRTPLPWCPLECHASALGFPVDDERDRRRDFFDERIDEYALTVRCDVVRIGVDPCRTWMDRE